MTIPSTIAHTVQQTQEWIKELRDSANLSDEATALSVLFCMNRATAYRSRKPQTLVPSSQSSCAASTLKDGLPHVCPTKCDPSRNFWMRSL